MTGRLQIAMAAPDGLGAELEARGVAVKEVRGATGSVIDDPVGNQLFFKYPRKSAPDGNSSGVEAAPRGTTAVARCPDAGVSFLTYCNSVPRTGDLHESTILPSRSTDYDLTFRAFPHRGRYCPRSAGGQESSPRNQHQRTQNGRQLLLAPRKVQSRSPRLPGKRERLHRRGDEPHRAAAEEAL